MDWINTAYGLVTLIGACIGLIGTGIGAFFSVRNWIKAMKEKSAKELWTMVMSMADSAMKEAERLAKEGKLAKDHKKEYVVNMVKAGCKSAGLDIGLFLDQLSDYIDQCIDWHNRMNQDK